MLHTMLAVESRHWLMSAGAGSSPTANPLAYSVYEDVDGNNTLNIFDVASIKSRLGTALPSSTGGVAGFSPTAAASDTMAPSGANLVTRLKDEGVLE